MVGQVLPGDRDSQTKENCLLEDCVTDGNVGYSKNRKQSLWLSREGDEEGFMECDQGNQSRKTLVGLGGFIKYFEASYNVIWKVLE